MLDAAEKTALIARFQRDEKDTGSPEVQIAILSTRIAEMTRHLIAFPKDVHSRRGLYGMVARRRRLMKYLNKHKPEVYRELIKELGIRG
jgi:small subunit ribosomal protein S15